MTSNEQKKSNEHANTHSNRIPIKDVTVVTPPSTNNHVEASQQIYVRKVSGIFQRIRQRMNLLFMAVFALIPWLQYNGHQAVLFDITEQRFYLWGLTLWPQDLTLLAWAFIIGAFLLFFVTTFIGRVWCGYLCPQTVWTFIFIWFEEKIEGSANKRKKLDERKLDADKLWKKILKHSCWLFFSILTGLTFVGYFVPVDDLFLDFFQLNASFAIAATVWFFALCTYGNAGWMREIMCLHMCPYSRFQSAMFDKDTVTVSYDYNRGESRAPRSRKTDHKAAGLGDCIDCNLCVQVCPTGIDIRDGLQYECINCGACIDACNGVMDKMNYPRGLIRYTTGHELEGKKTSPVRAKLLGYGIVLLILSALFIVDFSSRIPLSLDIIRDRNELARENFNGEVENVYTLKILNKSQTDNTYHLSVKGIAGIIWHGPQEVTVKAAQVYTLPINLAVDPFELQSPITTITFVIKQTSPEDDVIFEQESRFFKKR